MDTYALVPVRRVRTPQVSLSPFGQMIAVLESHAASTSATHLGRVRWSSLPVRHLLADASALILDAVAKRAGAPLRTQADAEALAQATDARLNVGLLLIYGTPEAAADAFQSQAVAAIERAAAAGYRAGMALSDEAWRALMRGASGVAISELKNQAAAQTPADLASFWSRPAYFFLAACVKRGREYAQELRERVERLDRQNTARLSGKQVLEDVGFILRTIEWLEGGVSLEVRPQELVFLPAEIDQYEALLAVGSSVVRACAPFPGSDLCNTSDGLFSPWLNTAILKAALGDSEVNARALSPEQAVQAQERLREIPVETVVAQVLAWVRACAVEVEEPLFSRALVVIGTQVQQHVAFLVWSEQGPSPSFHFIDPYLGETQVRLSHAEAMEYLDPYGQESLVETLPDDLLAAIETALDWGSFDMEEFEMLLEGSTLPESVIIRHLDELRANARAYAIETLLERHPASVNALLDAGHIEWEPELSDRFAEHLSVSFCERALQERLPREKAFELHLSRYMTLLSRLSDEVMQALWGDPRLHDAILALLGTLLFDRSMDVGEVQVRELQARVGERFPHDALDAYAQFRSLIYADFKGTAVRERTMPRWEKTSGNRPTSWELVKRMRQLFGRELAGMIAMISEEDCYRRSLGNRADRDRRVAQFLLNRSRFYGSSS
ncbi:hypothetical protein HY631_00500 [Candidatus Uhrbacteria bacterium]|nr:hypothetical protein [Candidatus Uhrbacteria bacterium]